MSTNSNTTNQARKLLCYVQQCPDFGTAVWWPYPAFRQLWDSFKLWHNARFLWKKAWSNRHWFLLNITHVGLASLLVNPWRCAQVEYPCHPPRSTAFVWYGKWMSETILRLIHKDNGRYGIGGNSKGDKNIDVVGGAGSTDNFCNGDNPSGRNNGNFNSGYRNGICFGEW